MSARGSHSLHKCRILRSWKSYNRPRLRLPKPCSVPRLDFFKNTLESKVLRFQQVHRLRRKALVEVLCGLVRHSSFSFKTAPFVLSYSRYLLCPGSKAPPVRKWGCESTWAFIKSTELFCGRTSEFRLASGVKFFQYII